MLDTFICICGPKLPWVMKALEYADPEEPEVIWIC